MKSWHCPCGWVGHFPAVVKTGKIKDGAKWWTYLNYCPKCDPEHLNELKDKDLY